MEPIITMDYGSGGQKTSELIEKMIVPAFENEMLAQLGDGAVLDMKPTGQAEKENGSKLVFSTDSFVVSPYFFPGGDIGKLAVCGTVNDIAVSGGIPQYLSLSAILEEGVPVGDLERIIASAAATAEKAGVKIVTGDTKVVEKGKGDGIYLNTAGIGLLAHSDLSPANLSAGDAVLVSGPIGNHGVAVMLARNPGFMDGDIRSDCAPVHLLAQALYPLGKDLRVMRDPTRGGVATTLCEFAEYMRPADPEKKAGERRTLSIELKEDAIPVDYDVQAACEILGLDPLYCACEGRLLAVVSAEKADEALRLLRAVPGGECAAVIGRVTDAYEGRVVVKTTIGGTRILTKLSGSQLPRIC